MPTQNTFLASYRENNGKNKIVVACEDFCVPNARLIEFSKLALAITSRDKKVTHSIEVINEVVEKSNVINNKEQFIKNFWNMFIGDALIGNSDRHFDNFGILESNGNISNAPVYDCGSALSALITDEDMEKLIDNEADFSSKEYNIPSALNFNEKRIFYHEIFKNPPKELVEAIERITPNIDVKKIDDIIKNTEGMSDIRKKYLAKSVLMRYDKMLKPAFRKIQKTKSNIKMADYDYNFKKYMESCNFVLAYRQYNTNITSKFSKSDIPLNFMKEVVKKFDTNTLIICDALNAVTEAENETDAFMSKLLNDTLKTEEYKKAFDAEQSKTQENVR